MPTSRSPVLPPMLGTHRRCRCTAELTQSCPAGRCPAGAVLLELCTAVDAATLAGLVEGASAPLAPWLTAPAADASPEALLLALRHWPRLPATAAAACPLLPGGFKAKQLPAALFSDPAAAAGSKAVAAAAAAFFTKQHLAALLPVLRATTAAHPRLHSVWPTLLALLIPGFSADKVRWRGRLGVQAGGASRVDTAAMLPAPQGGRCLLHCCGPATPPAASGCPIAATIIHRPPAADLCCFSLSLRNPQEQRDTGSGKAPARPAAAPLEAFWSTVVDGDLVGVQLLFQLLKSSRRLAALLAITLTDAPCFCV